MIVAEGGKRDREERLVKALRDNLRRRKAAHGDPAKRAVRMEEATATGRAGTALVNGRRPGTA
jgi:hypothetical protein